MKKLSTILAMLFAALICVTSCGSSSSGDDEPTPAPSNVILSAKDFVGTEWHCTDDNGKVTLKVNSATEMTLNYYTKESVAKHTETEQLNTVTITYTFNEKEATFSGKGKEDSQDYSGKLSAARAMKLKMPSQEVSLSR